jgi:tRNA(Arg) A34 adenosine deaminase TadA/glycerol-3-phosphate cytidylyltransferase-like family protein
VKPGTAVLISGSFEPFGEYYFRLLSWAASLGRPLVVIVQKDDMVARRRGFQLLTASHKARAEMVAAMEFVDLVVVANRTAHDRYCLQRLIPKVVAFQNDNLDYRRTIAEELGREFKGVRFSFAKLRKRDFPPVGAPANLPPARRDVIARRLLRLSADSRGLSSKISALIVDEHGKIVAQAANSESEQHAEMLAIDGAAKRSGGLGNCTMHVLIPPCVMCARAIAASGIRRVRYLFSYGQGDGVRLLRNNGVDVRPFGAEEWKG